MLMGTRGQRHPADVIGNAMCVAEVATAEVEDTKLEQPAKRRSGLAGSKVHAKKLTAEDRSEIARKVAKMRWE